MATVQSSYSETMRAGLPGMIANAETQNVITRTNAGATAIPFGQPVIRSGDHGCVLASQETLEAVGAVGVPPPAGATITAAPTVSAGAKEGVYHITCIVGGSATASKWQVQDPDGVDVGVATGNTAFSEGGLAFTITDSGTDPVVGEEFIITLTPSTATADLDVLGMSVRDTSLDVGAGDVFVQYAPVPVMPLGAMWVTAGAGGVTAGGQVYWNVSAKRFTETATDLLLTGWKFDTAGSNGDIVKIARR